MLRSLAFFTMLSLTLSGMVVAAEPPTVELALSEEARAVRCSDCASCAVHCPNGVRVAERLIRAQELFV